MNDPDRDESRRPAPAATADARATHPPVSGTRRALIVLPVLLVLAAGAAWSGAWFWAAGRASAEIDGWIAREAGQGRNWSCGERTIGGFPFRFELICAQPRLVFAGADGWEVGAERAHAVAQVWAPNHIIAEFASPAAVTEVASGRRFEARWSLLQTSAIGSGGRPDRVSVAADGLEIVEAGAAAAPPAPPLLVARHAEMHVRRVVAETREAFDFAAGVHGARSGSVALPAVGRPAPIRAGSTAAKAGGDAGLPPPPLADLEIQARVTGVADLHSMPVEERLRAWQAADGRLDLILAKITSGDAALTASGALGLDPRGRLDGSVRLALAGGDRLLTQLAEQGVLPPAVAALGPTLLAAGTPTEIDGRKAVQFPFAFRGGKISLGFIPLGSIGPLY
ncbi:DUF2125 domain-containing protein [Ancylobacter terrae]|uniref:DUF2125 domain-containing protein n=1 Tax=Ancylobacter sp. sgz301288 TaxID=3342077 RepID=UPI003859A6B8